MSSRLVFAPRATSHTSIPGPDRSATNSHRPFAFKNKRGALHLAFGGVVRIVRFSGNCTTLTRPSVSAHGQREAELGQPASSVVRPSVGSLSIVPRIALKRSTKSCSPTNALRSGIQKAHSPPVGRTIKRHEVAFISMGTDRRGRSGSIHHAHHAAATSIAGKHGLSKRNKRRSMVGPPDDSTFHFHPTHTNSSRVRRISVPSIAAGLARIGLPRSFWATGSK
jgi:hypothetical protein